MTQAAGKAALQLGAAVAARPSPRSPWKQASVQREAPLCPAQTHLELSVLGCGPRSQGSAGGHLHQEPPRDSRLCCEGPSDIPVIYLEENPLEPIAEVYY